LRSSASASISALRTSSSALPEEKRLDALEDLERRTEEKALAIKRNTDEQIDAENALAVVTTKAEKNQLQGKIDCSSTCSRRSLFRSAVLLRNPPPLAAD
jgi:hypothetical protein